MKNKVRHTFDTDKVFFEKVSVSESLPAENGTYKCFTAHRPNAITPIEFNTETRTFNCPLEVEVTHFLVEVAFIERDIVPQKGVFMFEVDFIYGIPRFIWFILLMVLMTVLIQNLKG
jgi:hypothetical protein